VSRGGNSVDARISGVHGTAGRLMKAPQNWLEGFVRGSCRESLGWGLDEMFESIDAVDLESREEWLGVGRLGGLSQKKNDEKGTTLPERKRLVSKRQSSERDEVEAEIEADNSGAQRIAGLSKSGLVE